ncbi:hypothetical protein Dda_3761 [Drechslerella dactyloides]|uniref:HNH nuclease domain-containing protein n=1 Tax=Drechslerella dactyloides TaxID=74499 RepID=A0AAD6IYZ8_DREDA|nr:hypothetical protein Dda_3761 [Drechslerella dactyloides]
MEHPYEAAKRFSVLYLTTMASDQGYNKTRYAASTDQDFHFVDGKNQEIGRSEQSGSITWDDVMEWFSIVYPNLEPGTYRIHQCTEAEPKDPLRRHGRALDMKAAKNHLILANKWYVVLGLDGYLVTLGDYIKVEITSEKPGLRIPPSPRPPHDYRYFNFWEAVRLRDRMCILSGLRLNQKIKCPKLPAELVSCHIFPPELIDEWNRKKMGSKVTDKRNPGIIGKTKINSPQNGVLVDLLLFKAFTTNKISINPRKGYKITTFRTDGEDSHVDSKRAHINKTCGDYDRVSDELLYNHYRESVIINMTGREGIDAVPEFSKWSRLGGGNLNHTHKEGVELFLAKRLAIDVNRDD